MLVLVVPAPQAKTVGVIYINALNALGKVAVPPAVVTEIFFEPAVPVGVTAVIDVSLTTTTLVAATPPTFTLDPTIKFVPVIVMTVPPVVSPTFGLTDEIVGAAT